MDCTPIRFYIIYDYNDVPLITIIKCHDYIHTNLRNHAINSFLYNDGKPPAGSLYGWRFIQDRC